jgi:peptidyl-prolyl cis-trans isomerase-like 1
MDKLKSMFGKHDDSSAASSNTASHSASTPSGAQSGGNAANAEGVTLHTTLGDITIALFKDQTPKVSINDIAQCWHHSQYHQLTHKRPARTSPP